MTPEKLKQIRKALKMTQTEFAEALGFSSQVYISWLESGKRKVSKPLENHINMLLKLKRVKVDL